MKKFELTSETMVKFGKTFYRIKALIDFSNVKTGDLGGWVSREEDLCQEDKSWVYDNSTVDNSTVRNNSTVYNSTVDNSTVRNNSTVHNSITKSFTGLCEFRITAYFCSKDSKYIIQVGCVKHSIDEWISLDDGTYKDKCVDYDTVKKAVKKVIGFIKDSSEEN